jgi:hypothetical protein
MSTFRDRTLCNILDSYVSTLAIPDEITTLINQANADLYGGPLYLDADGEDCSCFDEGARQFNFSAACEEIETALGDVSDLWADLNAEDWNDREPEAEEIDGEVFKPFWEDWRHVERHEIIAHICGRELARHVR